MVVFELCLFTEFNIPRMERLKVKRLKVNGSRDIGHF